MNLATSRATAAPPTCFFTSSAADTNGARSSSRPTLPTSNGPAYSAKPPASAHWSTDSPSTVTPSILMRTLGVNGTPSSEESRQNVRQPNPRPKEPAMIANFYRSFSPSTDGPSKLLLLACTCRGCRSSLTNRCDHRVPFRAVGFGAIHGHSNSPCQAARDCCDSDHLAGGRSQGAKSRSVKPA
jgi:hypothetical protein